MQDPLHYGANIPCLSEPTGGAGACRALAADRLAPIVQYTVHSAVRKRATAFIMRICIFVLFVCLPYNILPLKINHHFHPCHSEYTVQTVQYSIRRKYAQLNSFCFSISRTMGITSVGLYITHLFCLSINGCCYFLLKHIDSFFYF